MIHLINIHPFVALGIVVFLSLLVTVFVRAILAMTGRYDEPVKNLQQGGAVVARKAHNLEVAGAIPAPATNVRQDVRTDAQSLACSVNSHVRRNESDISADALATATNSTAPRSLVAQPANGGSEISPANCENPNAFAWLVFHAVALCSSISFWLRFKRVCKWHQPKPIRMSGSPLAPNITHGMCPDCAKKWETEIAVHAA